MKDTGTAELPTRTAIKYHRENLTHGTVRVAAQEEVRKQSVPNANIHPRRNIVIVDRGSAVDGVITALVDGLGRDSILAPAGRELAQIDRERYDAVIFDLRRVDLNGDSLPQVAYIRPTLVDRILLVTAELSESKLTLMESCLAASLPRRPLRRFLRRLFNIFPALGGVCTDNSRRQPAQGI